MKTTFKSLMMFAAAAMTLAGCEKEVVSENAAPEVSVEKITVKATIKNAATRVSVSGENGKYSAVWDEGDAIDIVEFAGKSGSITEDTAYQVVAAENIEIADELAMFEAELEKVEGDGFTYYAVYPGGNDDSFVVKKYQELVLPMPAVQKPTAESLIDPKANVVIAKAETDAQAPDLYFDEVINAASYARMTIKGLPEGVTPKTVKFENKTISGNFGVNIAGCYWYMVNDGTYKAAYGASVPNATTTITVDQSEAQDKNVVWFGLAPIGEISNFAVTVTGSDDKEYVKTVTGASLNFTAGNILNFSVTVAEPEPAKDWSGTYAILLTNSSKAAYYMVSSVSYAQKSDSLGFTETDYTGAPVEDANSEQIWVVEKQDDGSYTFMNGTKYMDCAKDGNVASMSDSKTFMTIEDNTDGSIYIHPKSYASRYLSRQTDFVRFYNFNGSYYQNAYLVEISVKPSISVGSVSTIVSEGGEGSIEVTIANATSVDVKAYDEAEASTECTWLTNLSWKDNKLSFSASENTTGAERTAYIVVTATNNDGEKSQTIEVKQIAPGTKIAKWVEVTTVTEGDYIICGEYNNNGTLYYLPNAAATSAPASVVLPAAVYNSDDNSITNPTEAMRWTFTASGNGFVIASYADGTNKLGCIADNNGLRVGNYTHVWTFATSNSYGWTICNTSLTSNRYLAVYQATSWRTYTSNSTNQNGKFHLFKLEE